MSPNFPTSISVLIWHWDKQHMQNFAHCRSYLRLHKIRSWEEMNWIGKHYSQVPVLANKKLFASTPCLVHYPRGQGNKMANWKSCIGCWERFGVYISLGGVLTNTHFAIFAIIVLSTKKLLAYLLVMIVIRSNCYPVQNLSVSAVEGGE